MKARLTTLLLTGAFVIPVAAQVRTTGPALSATGPAVTPGITPIAPAPTSPLLAPNVPSALAGAPPAAGGTFSQPTFGAPVAGSGNPVTVSPSGFPPPV